MAGVLRSDDPNRSNDERRRDQLAWAAIHHKIRHTAWRRIDVTVSDVVPTARERGLLRTPWQVFLWGATGGYVTIQPSGEWEFGSLDAKTGLVEVLARSSEPGHCDVAISHVHYVKFALARDLHREP